MKILILGAAGMVGRKLTDRLVADGRIGDTKIDDVALVDMITPTPPTRPPFTVTTTVADIGDPNSAAGLIAAQPDLIFHLAAIVSGEAEADFDKGYRINLDGTRWLFDAVRLEQGRSGGAYWPRMIFTSSLAVFGAPFHEVIDDEFHLTPLTSYGTQKAIDELLLNDYTRRGCFDGIGIRLPTICVRPGKPNLAASGFFSNIIREPLAGQEAILPVSEDVRHWHASPRSAVGFLIHAASLDLAKVGPRRNLSMPGLSVTVGEQIEALRRVAGSGDRRPHPQGAGRNGRPHRIQLGRATSIRGVHANWVSWPRQRSTRSFGLTSTTNWAVVSRRDRPAGSHHLVPLASSPNGQPQRRPAPPRRAGWKPAGSPAVRSWPLRRDYRAFRNDRQADSRT